MRANYGVLNLSKITHTVSPFSFSGLHSSLMDPGISFDMLELSDQGISGADPRQKTHVSIIRYGGQLDTKNTGPLRSTQHMHRFDCPK